MEVTGPLHPRGEASHTPMTASLELDPVTVGSASVGGLFIICQMMLVLVPTITDLRGQPQVGFFIPDVPRPVPGYYLISTC